VVSYAQQACISLITNTEKNCILKKIIKKEIKTFIQAGVS